MIWFSASGTPTYDPKVYLEGFDFFYDSFEELHTYTQHMAYSTMSFRHGKRHGDSVEGYGSILIYDIDEGYTGQELRLATEGFRRLIVTTMSHTKEKPRMRLIFKLNKEIPADTPKDLYKALMTFTAKMVGLHSIDEKCVDTARAYAPNPTQQHFYLDGETLNIDTLLVASTKQLERDKEIQRQKYALKTVKFSGSDKTKSDWYRENLNTQLMYDKLGFDDKAPSGRNCGLNQIGYYLLSDVGLQPAEVASAVMYVNSMYSNPLPEREIENTIFRSLKIGGIL